MNKINLFKKTLVNNKKYKFELNSIDLKFDLLSKIKIRNIYLNSILQNYNIIDNVIFFM